MVTDQQANRLIKLMKEEQTKGAAEDKARKVMNGRGVLIVIRGKK